MSEKPKARESKPMKSQQTEKKRGYGDKKLEGPDRPSV